MYILLYPDIFIYYLENRDSLSKSKKQNLINNLIESDATKIVLSEYYLSKIQEYFTDQNKSAFFEKSLQRLIDFYSTSKFHIIKYNKQGDLMSCFNNMGASLGKQEIVYLLKNSDSSNLEFISYDNLVESPTSLGWIKLNLLTNKNLNFDHSEFKTNAEIQSFFENFLKLLSNKNLLVFSRDHLVDASIFSSIKSNKFNVSYYTRNFETSVNRRALSNDVLKNVLSSLKNKLGKNSELWVTNNPDLIHERRMVSTPFKLILDDDFNNLDVKRKTWSISLIRDERKCEDYIKKCSKFNQFK